MGVSGRAVESVERALLLVAENGKLLKSFFAAGKRHRGS